MTITVSTWLPDSVLWTHTKDTSRAKPEPFAFHPALLIEYCLKPFLSTRKSDMFRLKQSALWVRLLEKLSAIAGGPLARHSRLPAAWSVSQMLPASCCDGPGVQAIRYQGL